MHMVKMQAYFPLTNAQVVLGVSWPEAAAALWSPSFIYCTREEAEPCNFVTLYLQVGIKCDLTPLEDLSQGACSAPVKYPQVDSTPAFISWRLCYFRS